MQIIVCESRGTWATALRRVLPVGSQLRESRSLIECAAHLLAATNSLVVVELTADNAPQVIERVELWRRRFPASVMILVAARELASWRDLAIEAGVACFLTSPRELLDVAAILDRHRRRFPQPATATAERIWKELPFATAVA
jgi:AmiR/NasT family two-component response regulator